MPYQYVNKPKEFGRTYDWVRGDTVGRPFYQYEEYWYDGTNISTSNPRSRDGKYRDGSAWYMCQTVNRYECDEVTIMRPGYGPAFIGRPTVNQHQNLPDARTWAHLDDPNYRANAIEALRSRGAEAWSRMKPAQPSFDLGLNLLELKDTPSTLRQATRVVIDRMRKKRLRQGKTLESLSRTGEWYLAIEFGWLPILSAVQDFIKTQREEQKIFDQIVRDAGRPVRRRRDLKDSKNDSNVRSVINYGFFNFQPSLVTQCWGDSGRSLNTTQKEFTANTWCEGRFRYFLPPGPRTVEWKKRILRRIYGLRPTPSLVYNLMPWSWLADYFSDLGQFMNAVSDGVEDNLICDYAYLMQTITSKTKTTAARTYVSNLGEPRVLRTVAPSLTTTTETKIRVAASPFGFGFKEQDLSLKQTAILGALGLSRLPAT